MMRIKPYLISEIESHQVEPIYSTGFEAILTGIRKRLKHRVSFDVLKMNNQNYVTKVGVRVPNSNYYTCMIGELEVNQGITTFGIHTFRFQKERYNFNWGNEWRGASTTTKIPRAVSTVSKIEPLYDSGVLNLAVQSMENEAQDRLGKAGRGYAELDSVLCDTLASYSLRVDTTALVKQFIEASRAGQVASLDYNNPVLQKYDEYCTKKKELQEELTHIGERVLVHVIKLFNCEDIIMRMGYRQARVSSVSNLPENVQTLVHTVNLMAKPERYSRQLKACSVGVVADRDEIVEDHYVVFLPIEEAERLSEKLNAIE